jgi:SOS-response transcriptional repressor LexA
VRTASDKPLTDRQAEILLFIEAEVFRRGSPPTVREIGARFGISSPTGIMCHLAALEAKGKISRDHGKSRNVTVLDLRCPHCGHRLADPPQTPEPAPETPQPEAV